MARLNDIEPDSGQGDGHRPGLLARLFGAGEDPLTWWSFPLIKVGGLRVRAHSFLVPLWMGIEMLAWLPKTERGPIHVFSALGALLVLALIHELGRGHFARWLGDGGDCVVLWPLGGLNAVSRRGATHPVAAESGGLVANILLVPVLALVAMGVHISQVDLVFNPLDPRAINTALGNLNSVEQIVVWWAYFMNLVILSLNAFVPMLPMDAGRMMHAWLRGRSNTPAETGARIGFVAAFVLGIVAISVDQSHLVGVAVLGAIATFLELRRHEFIGPARDDLMAETHIPHEEVPVRKAPQPVPNTELDAVLEKISREGMDSLTSGERQVLARETERRRRG